MSKEETMARRIAQSAAQRGGRAYFVGGCVRDSVMGRSCKDIDIEVHGLTAECLTAILDELGSRMTYGADFGVCSMEGCHLDIALPRRERALGRGHRDFEVVLDPFIGMTQAARRRDFTVNAMMRDVLTGEIIDPFGGMEDIRRGVIRHVDAGSFSEDPLRMLRAAQFAARLGFSVAPETLELCRHMDLSTLTRERVMAELRKALLDSERPSAFFGVLRQADQLGWFPELRGLIGVRQDPQFHPEGDVWTHTMQVVDAAAALRDRTSFPMGFMLSAICHDFGKQVTSELVDDRIHSYGHEAAGVPLASQFITRLTGEIRLVRYAENMVKLHMRPGSLVAQHSGQKAFMKLFDEAISPEDLILLSVADRIGSGLDPGIRVDTAQLDEQLREYKRRMKQPYVTASDLRAAGIPPGPVYGEALAYAHRLLLSGVSRKDALGQTLAYARRQENGEK